MDYQTHFSRLDQLLTQYQWLWRYQPFKDQNLTWPKPLSAFYRALLSLNDGELESLQSPLALHHFASDYLPELSEITPLIDALDAPPSSQTEHHVQNSPESLIRGISGLKLTQIQRFSALSYQQHQHKQWVDWCAGKGHLAKHLNHLSEQGVTCIEIDQALCQQGEQWAKLNDQNIRFVHHDMLNLSDEQIVQLHIGQAHHCALHACGDLHIHFLKQAVKHEWPQLSLAPCCYQKVHAFDYPALSNLAKKSKLKLNKEDLALSVQETATAKARETKQRIALNGFRLGFDELQRDITQSTDYLSLPSTSVTWLDKGFGAFCRSMAERKEIRLPDGIDFAPYLTLGKRRYAKVRRLELARQSFRRPLELWLVLDRVLFLEQSGYEADFMAFCPRNVSARNILIQAIKR